MHCVFMSVGDLKYPAKDGYQSMEKLLSCTARSVQAAAVFPVLKAPLNRSVPEGN